MGCATSTATGPAARLKHARALDLARILEEWDGVIRERH
jgi:hypothetical protein